MKLFPDYWHLGHKSTYGPWYATWLDVAGICVSLLVTTALFMMRLLIEALIYNGMTCPLCDVAGCVSIVMVWVLTYFVMCLSFEAAWRKASVIDEAMRRLRAYR